MRRDQDLTGTRAPSVGPACLAGLVALAAVGCGQPQTDRPAQTADAGLAEFPSDRFGASTTIDNPWMPLTPGTRFVYEGTTVEDDGTVLPHRVVINVTDLTKMIGGVRTVVTWDLDYADGELVEAELAFFAQDDDGTVWRVGEYPEEYEDGEFVEAPAWIHGFQEARAGIMMLADPQPGAPSYAQGWGPAVDWTDRGHVVQIADSTCVRADCYHGVLVIAETSAAEPGAEQLKYYARGVGNVRVGWRGAGDPTKETLELVEVVQLDAAALAEVRTSALALERNAYERSKNVYGPTPPLERSDTR